MNKVIIINYICLETMGIGYRWRCDSDDNDILSRHVGILKSDLQQVCVDKYP